MHTEVRNSQQPNAQLTSGIRHEGYTTCQSVNLKGRDRLEDLAVDRMILLTTVFRKEVERMQPIDSYASGRRPVTGSCEHDNVTSVSMKG